MFKLVLTNVLHRPLRSLLTVGGIALAVATLLMIDRVGASYRANLFRELNMMGVHLMIVPLGCPYDAAARVLKGNTLETSLPATALDTVKDDPGVEIAAPLLIAAVPRQDQGRTDMFVGLDENGIALKSWWKAAAGSEVFGADDSLILGSEAAQIEMRKPGDALYSPETGRRFTVTGVLERSGMSDDSLFFVPLRTAQEMFHSSNRVTAIAIRLRDPATLTEVSARLQEIPGAQVVTQTEMMGTFLNILGTVRTLLQSIALVAVCASIAGLVNTLMMSVAERSFEFSLFRAVGASQGQLFGVVLLESLLLTMGGVVLGVAGCVVMGGIALGVFAAQLPFLTEADLGLPAASVGLALVTGGIVAVVTSIFPAWRALGIEPAEVLKGTG